MLKAQSSHRSLDPETEHALVEVRISYRGNDIQDSGRIMQQMKRTYFDVLLVGQRFDNNEKLLPETRGSHPSQNSAQLQSKDPPLAVQKSQTFQVSLVGV